MAAQVNNAMIFADHDEEPMDYGSGSDDNEDVSENEDEETEIPADFVAPTADEMNELKETKELFKSNLFKLQIEELLSEVSIKYNKTSKLEGFLHRLKTALDELPEVEVPIYLYILSILYHDIMYIYISYLFILHTYTCDFPPLTYIPTYRCSTFKHQICLSHLSPL